jgi:hypothetical protein
MGKVLLQKLYLRLQLCPLGVLIHSRLVVLQRAVARGEQDA